MRRAIYCHIALLLLLQGLPGTSPALAQPADRNDVERYWLGGGLGVCSLGDMAGNVNGCCQVGSILLSARVTVNTAGLFADEFFDLAALAGLTTRSARGHASIGVGLSRVTGSRCEGLNLFSTGTCRKPIAPTIGLPIEAQLFRYLSRSLGAGLYLYANLNKEENLAGITFNLIYGKLR